MSKLAAPLRDVLEHTGYLAGGEPAAPSVALHGSDNHVRLPSFRPDAWWRSSPEATAWPGRSDLKVYFKFVEQPDPVVVAEWQREVWNQGFCPLLWLVSPERIEIYNGFGVPRERESARRHVLDTFQFVEDELARLDRLAGRLAMETGQFWRQRPDVNRASSVDRQLLRALAALKGDLEASPSGLSGADAQALIGRCIFTQYLIDRRIVDQDRLEQICGHRELPGVLLSPDATARLFGWLRARFNGDMFSPTEESVPAVRHLRRMRDFLTATDPVSGQRSLFPYRFEVIPVELISAIYEQFVHSTGTSEQATGQQVDVFYTPLTAVSLVMDEVFADLTGAESVLDLTCGSGVFLVEALRRLVYLKADGGVPTRAAIRQTLHEQVYGVDVSPEAVNIAAFSLYLAALELDPDPRDADGVKFQPLVDRSLRVSDAFHVDLGPRKFDVIVGNPPWSFQGRMGTSVRRTRSPGAARSPRGESLDFVTHAMRFAHGRTRFGVVLSATPFFTRSATGIAAARRLVESLGPVTLVNLSELSKWLFPRANMPAMALVARHTRQRADRMTLVQARWSPAGELSHTIEIAPGDVTTLPIASWQRNPGLFKAAFLGRRHDLLLLDDLWENLEPLDARLRALGTALRSGLIFGDRSRDSEFLKGLPFVQRRDIGHFMLPPSLPKFDQDRAERPRGIDTYRAPLLLIKEFLLKKRPRLFVAVAEQDTVYSDACFGVSFGAAGSDAAHLAAGILGSALATWYFLMTGSAFGIWMRRVKRSDIGALPAPDLEQALGSEAGIRIVRLVRAFHDRAGEPEWRSLDDAVFDLYGFDDEDRVVVRDGLFQASWQWQKGKLNSVEPADEADLKKYARAFLATMDAWLGVANRRRMRAEIYRVPDEAPLRVIRFVLEEAPGPSREVKAITPNGPLSSVLASIGERTSVRITDELVGLRDLRVHAEDEVSIIKPAARRNWLRVQALEDADGVVSASVYTGGAP